MNYTTKAERRKKIKSIINAAAIIILFIIMFGIAGTGTYPY